MIRLEIEVDETQIRDYFNDENLIEHKIGPHFYLVFDESDDFDFPSDYDVWIEKHNALKE